jgi:hypothetical protein
MNGFLSELTKEAVTKRRQMMAITTRMAEVLGVKPEKYPLFRAAKTIPAAEIPRKGVERLKARKRIKETKELFPKELKSKPTKPKSQFNVPGLYSF